MKIIIAAARRRGVVHDAPPDSAKSRPVGMKHEPGPAAPVFLAENGWPGASPKGVGALQALPNKSGGPQ